MPRFIQLLIWTAIGAVLTVAAVLLWSHRSERAVIIQPQPIDATIVVDVRGAVATPGVVRLPASARVADAVNASGGLRDDADVSRLNLASRLADGQRLVIPTGAPETAVAPSSEPTPPPRTPASKGPATASPRLININVATAQELKSLPGIGDVLAGRIVAYREANGPFRSVDQLSEVRGVSSKLIESLRPLVTVGG